MKTGILIGIAIPFVLLAFTEVGRMLYFLAYAGILCALGVHGACLN